MACAAVMRPVQSGIFRGDADNMLDMLVAACEQRPIAKTACSSWVGRELVPWTDDAAQLPACSLDQPLELSGRRQVSKFPCSQKHARSVQQPASRMPESPEHRRQAPKRSKVGGNTPPRASSPRAVQPAPANSSSFACPAVAASPKPEAIPMPSTLMSRALARGRSPSPPKEATSGCFAAMPALQQVRAVAA